MVITGAGSGIGQSLAVQLNQEGGHLAVGDIDSESLAETHGLLSQDSKVSLYTVDISSQRQMWSICRGSDCRTWVGGYFDQ